MYEETEAEFVCAETCCARSAELRFQGGFECKRAGYMLVESLQRANSEIFRAEARRNLASGRVLRDLVLFVCCPPRSSLDYAVHSVAGFFFRGLKNCSREKLTLVNRGSTLWGVFKYFTYF